MSQAPVLPLDQIDLHDAPTTGMKAATLGHLFRSGVPVPNGFVVPTSVFEGFVEQNGLGIAIVELESVFREPGELTTGAALLARIHAGFERGELPARAIEALRGAFGDAIQETGAVVVRSSAIGEDLPEASFAGQHATVLNVRTFEALLKALRRCWASAFGPSVVRYRARLAPTNRRPSIAVIVQTQIICQAAGTMLTVDPLDDDSRLVVEAVWGLGEALAQGEVSPDRYLVDRETLSESARPRIGDKRCQRVLDFTTGTRLAAVPLWRRRRPVLNRAQVGGLALLGLQIERRLAAPQDVEWGLAGGRWFCFQARPITARLGRSSAEAADRVASREWTSSFLDERLGEPVSPLGWSILRRGLEDIAFREPLRILGVDPSDLEPMTRLWRGRPYVSVAVFEAIYKLFPDVLLPEDAHRFFPGRDASRRKRAPRPESLLSPRVWAGVIGAIARAPATASPFHNDRAWDRFESRYVRAIAEIGFTVGVLEREASPSLRKILDLVDDVERQNRQLLRIHRWSLT
ncbi:MAG: PEP/pyruvate-binding domain-containing protein, partial [Chloroflexota bacterium]